MNLLQILIPEHSEAGDSGDLSVRPLCLSVPRSQLVDQATCQYMVSTFMSIGLSARYRGFSQVTASKLWEYKTTMLAKIAMRDLPRVPH